VYHEIDIAPWEAVLGAEVVVPTLDGSIKVRRLGAKELAAITQAAGG
jgi:DnaJ-class molecular chaperone